MCVTNCGPHSIAPFWPTALHGIKRQTTYTRRSPCPKRAFQDERETKAFVRCVFTSAGGNVSPKEPSWYEKETIVRSLLRGIHLYVVDLWWPGDLIAIPYSLPPIDRHSHEKGMDWECVFVWPIKAEENVSRFCLYFHAVQLGDRDLIKIF